MSVNELACRLARRARLFAAMLFAGVMVASCTPQPTNLVDDAQTTGNLGSGMGGNTVGIDGPLPGAGGGPGGGGEGPNVNNPLGNGTGGGAMNPVASDDASCRAGYPPQEDPTFERVRRIADSDPAADAMFGQMQLNEKLTIMAGYVNFDWNNGTAFEAAPVPRLDYPTFRMRDGPRGVRGVVQEQSTTFPVAEARAAAFDIDLEERIGRVFAAEMRALRIDLLLAPTINVLRHPAWARAQETYGEDPIVNGELGAAFVRGVQNGPQGMPACPKHYAGNNTDENRGSENRRGVNVVVDEQNLRENYTRAFGIIIEKADPACIMAAYNDVNGQPNTENSHLITDILRGAPGAGTPLQRGFGWKGFMLSDWGATLGPGHGALALEAGLDIEMPNPYAFQDLGAPNAAQIDLAARRILNVRAQFGQLSDAYRQAHEQAQDRNIVNNQEHRALTREAAEKGAVLLKNNNVLPLGMMVGTSGTPTVQSIVFLGPDSDIPRDRPADQAHGLGDGGSSQTFPAYRVSFADGIANRAGAGVSVTQSQNPADAAGKTIAIIPVTMAHQDEGEAYGGGGDRDTMTLSTVEPRHWTGQKPTAFINAVRAAAPGVKIVVVLAVGSAIVMEDWIDQADAIVQTFYPGQEGGNALARLLFGDVNFSGKLPFTVATNPDHYPYFGNRDTQVEFDYLHGYRLFEEAGTPPRFWFGHGLSYTTYEYSDPVVLCPSGIGSSGRLNVEVTVRNTGTVAGDEVVQLFVKSPATPGLLHPPPPKELKAFTRVSLAPGESKTVQLFVPARDLRHWGPNGWELATGEHTVFVGPSADPAALKAAAFTVN